MERYIKITFVNRKISVRARLLLEEMPETCSAIQKNLPRALTAEGFFWLSI